MATSLLTTPNAIAGDPLDDIARRAATLAARHRALVAFAAHDECYASGMAPRDGVLDAWRALVAPDTPANFATRLRWAGLTAEQAALVATPDGLPLAHDDAESTWMELFRDALGSSADDVASRFGSAVVADAANVLLVDDAKPFDVLVLPFVACAREQLSRRLGARRAVATDAVHLTWERHLVQRLTDVCGRALFSEFVAQRTGRTLDPLAALMRDGGGVPRTEYQRFVARMARGELFDFFTRYPVAARLTATTTSQWISAAGDFFSHLDMDLPSLQTTVSDGRPLGRAVSVSLGAGDTHNGGRAVAIVTFTSGCRVVYKPRALQLEGLFAALLRWVAERDPGAPTLMAPRSVEREDHGWVAFVAQHPCESIDAAQRFYERAGLLLALLYGIDGTDFHLENLIAHGEHPVLIDMEALLSHELSIEGRLNRATTRGFEAVNRRVNSSVARTGLLPAFKLTNGGAAAVSTAGLAGDGEAESLRDSLGWRHANTDVMRMTVKHAPPSPQQNVPYVGDVPQYAGAYVEEIVRGFRRGYHLLVEHRHLLMARDSVLREYGHRHTRLIFRHTSLYGAALLRSLNPDLLRDGARRFIEFDVLARPLLRLDAHPGLDRVLDAEHAALEVQDVPLFTARVDSRALSLPDGSLVEDFFDRSAIEQTEHRLSMLDDTDLAQQCEFIRMAFNAGGVVGVAPLSHATSYDVADESSATSPVTPADALAVAEGIAQALLRMSVGTGVDRAWYGLEYLARVRRHRLMPLGHGLADGHGGIALFFAALFRATNDRVHREIAHAAMQSVASSLDAIGGAAGWREVGTGMANGLGSVLRLHVLAASLLSDDSYLQVAHEVTARVRVPQMVNDSCDLLGGTSGAIVGLVDLHRATGSDLALSRAVELVPALLKHRAAIDALEPGMAHGRLGVAFALGRLARASGESGLAQIADTLIASVRVVWQDDVHAPRDWANGVSGLLLAELDGLVEREEDGACSRARNAMLGRVSTRTDGWVRVGSHGLAAGVAGMADVLLVAADALHDQSWSRAAKVLGQCVRNQLVSNGRLRTGWAPGFTHPGMLAGETGIGYAMLRLVAPDRVPSVLW